MNNIPDHVRDDFVEKMKAAGMPIADAHETVDLAIHAINSAIETAQNICRTGSHGGVIIAATQVAYGLLGQVAELHRQGAEMAARQLAEKMGVPIVPVGEQQEPG